MVSNLCCQSCNEILVYEPTKNLKMFKFSSAALLGFYFQVENASTMMSEYGKATWLNLHFNMDFKKIASVLNLDRSPYDIVYSIDDRVEHFGTLLCKCGNTVGHIDRSTDPSGVALLDFDRVSFISKEKYHHWGEVDVGFNTVSLLGILQSTYLMKRLDVYYSDAAERVMDPSLLILSEIDHEFKDVESFRHLTTTFPRAYQQEMYLQSLANDANVLLTLPTGWGKTLVGIMIIVRMLELNPTRQAVFLTETNALSAQQFNRIQHEVQKHGIKVSLLNGGSVTGKPGESKAVRQRREYELCKQLVEANIIVATAGSYLQAAKSRFIHIEKVCVFVLDEAHHCVGKHEYRKCVDLCMKEKAHFPKIIGLTAFPGAGVSTNEAIIKINSLCRGLGNARFLFPREKISYKELTQLDTELPLVLKTVPRYDYEVALQTRLVEYILKRLGIQNYTGYNQPCTELYSAMSKRMAHITCIEDVNIIKLFTAMRNLEEIGGNESWSTISDLDQTESKWRNVDKDVADVLQEYEGNAEGSCYIEIRKVLNRELLCSTERKEPFTCLIFISQREIARQLKSKLENDPEAKGIIPDYIVGLSDMSLSKQASKLQNLRNGVINVLISTTVCNEGIDIPRCNLVLCTALPSSTLNFVQIRGRVRASMKTQNKNNRVRSNFIALMRPNEEKPGLLLARYKEHEKYMYKAFMELTSKSSIENYEDEHDATSVHDSTLKPDKSFRSLLNEFCQKSHLPTYSKSFTNHSKCFKALLSIQINGKDISAEGLGRTKKIAEERAAFYLWNQVKNPRLNL